MSTTVVEELLRRKDYANALPAAKQAVHQHPTNAKAHALLGLIHFRQRRYEDAARCFDRATILDPMFWQAHLKLAQSLDRLQRYEEALRAAKAGLRVQPNDKELGFLAQGLARLAKPERTDAWEQSVHLDHYRIEIPNED